MGIVAGEIGEAGDVGGDAGAGGLVRLQEILLAGEKKAALAGFGIAHVAQHHLKLLADLIGVADQRLGIALIGGELHGDIDHHRQHKKKRHRAQQHQPVGSQNAPDRRIPRGRTR